MIIIILRISSVNVAFKHCPTPTADCFCMELFTDNDAVAHEGGEAHPYHYKCIEQWLKLNSTCPTCRADVELPSDILPSWQNRMISHLKLAAKGTAISLACLAAAKVIASDTSVAIEVLNSRWIQAAALCAAASLQSQIGSGRLYSIRKFLAGASFYVGLNAGASIGAVAHSPLDLQASTLGAAAGIAAVAAMHKSPARLAVSLGAITSTGLGAAALIQGAGLKETAVGSAAGAVTGAAAVAFSAIAIPVAMAWVFSRFSHRRG